jgi:hypothetical protein
LFHPSEIILEIPEKNWGIFSGYGDDRPYNLPNSGINEEPEMDMRN